MAARKPNQRLKESRNKPINQRRYRAEGGNPVVQGLADQLFADHSNVRSQLDILRQTRGQRNVGELTIPAHLRQSEMLGSADGVETRVDVAAVKPMKG